MQRAGTRLQVWEGTAERTAGGLTKKQLFQSPNGAIKSIRASEAAERRQARFIEEERRRNSPEARAQAEALRFEKIENARFNSNVYNWSIRLVPDYETDYEANDEVSTFMETAAELASGHGDPRELFGEGPIVDYLDADATNCPADVVIAVAVIIANSKPPPGALCFEQHVRTVLDTYDSAAAHSAAAHSATAHSAVDVEKGRELVRCWQNPGAFRA